MEFQVNDGGTSAIPLIIDGDIGQVRAIAWAATIVPFAVRGAASQSGNLTEWQTNVGGILASVDSGGNIWSSASLQGQQLELLERSSDPTQPAEGWAVIWMSDGTGKGDDGDVMVASKAGGTTNYGTLFDHSGGAGW
jgi:hypothetical protein